MMMNRSFSQRSGCVDVRDDERASSHRLIAHQHPQIVGYESLASEDRMKKQEIDEMLAQAMHGLTVEERQHQQDILHGVDPRIQEDETTLNSLLQDLDHFLSLANERRMLYETAQGMSPEYVNARHFRVMFLRANDYDPKAAADQMLRFFESKHQLFGPEKLVKDITLADLSKEDITCIQKGRLQLAGRDQSGRQIIVHFAGLPGAGESYLTANSWLRAQYFVVMRALLSEETQLRGTVCIWYGVGSFGNKASSQGYVDGFTACSVLPRKKQAIHVCVDDIHQYVMCSDVIKIMSGNMRARFRVHFGSQSDCQRHLGTFGISSNSIPVNDEGRLDMTRHMSWLQACATEDGVTAPSLQSIVAPNENDVIFTGGKISNHLGNQRFLSIIKDSIDIYDPGTDETKREVVEQIINQIHASGGRFLKKAHDNPATNWEPLSPDQLRKRVMQAFRNRRRLDAVKQQNANDSIPGAMISGRPRPSDVIFGRAQRNPGTELLSRLIKNNFEEYESLDRGVKMRFVESIMQTIIDQGGRFLQPATNSAGWFELAHEAARERISKYFRNHRRPPKKSK